MLSGYEYVIVAAVLLIYGAIRFLPRLIAGFGAYISAPEVKRMLDLRQPLLLLDVRSPLEFAADPGHIPGAINVPLDQLTARLVDPQFVAHCEQTVITICQTDSRAALALRALKRSGVAQPRVLSGGMNAWAQEGYPVVSTTRSSKIE